MKRKKWMIGIAAALLLLFAGKGIAHYRWSKLSTEEKAGTITEKMARRLDLSEDQRVKVYALNLEKVKIMEARWQSGEHRRADWKQLRDEWHEEMRAILRPDQQERFRH